MSAVTAAPLARAPTPSPLFSRRIELVQDLEFPAACHRLKLTPDGAHLFATGGHPPRVRVFDLANLSLKFERHLDSGVVDFQILGDDWAKAAFLCEDRSVELHARYGRHFRARVPRAGRDLAYVQATADLIIAGSSSDVWRLNLEEGRFKAPLAARAEAVNAVALCPGHGLLAAACEGGALELFDARSRSSAGWLDAATGAGCAGADLTTVRADARGLALAVGTAAGTVALYDVRSSRPLLVKDLMYGSPVVDLKFHGGEGGGDGDVAPAAASTATPRRVISADRHAIKIWAAADGAPHTTITPPGGGVNDVLPWAGRGLILVAADAPRVGAYFLPSLGPAPAWCSHLEGLTEELEEAAAPAVYDDYRFVDPPTLARLGLAHLVGTPALRPYMHGHFVHNKLWQRAQAAASPFAYEEYRRQKVEATLDAARSARIAPLRKLPKVNAATAARLMAGKSGADGNVPASVDASNPLGDDRFAAMFADPAFAVDEQAQEYKAAHPNAESNAKAKRLLAEHFAEVEDAGGASASASGSGSGSGSASDSGSGGSPRRASKRTRMFAAADPAAAAAYSRGDSLAAARAAPLAVRAAAAAAAGAGRGGKWVAGSREGTFVPRSGGGGGGGRGGRGGGRGGRGGRGTAAAGGRGRGGSRGGRGGRGRGRGR